MRFITQSIHQRMLLLSMIALIGAASSGCGNYSVERLRQADKHVHAMENRMNQVEKDANNIHRAKRSSDSEKQRSLEQSP